MHSPTQTEAPAPRRPGLRSPRPARYSLADVLRARTRALHRTAESTGVVADMLAGSVTHAAYALYLRNLLPVYECLEAALERRGDEPSWRMLALPALQRSDAMRSDLAALCGAGWRRSLTWLAAGQRYRERVAQVAQEPAGARLLAHIYTRYLGDLSGGRILGRLLARGLAIGPEALSVYRFPDLPADIDGFKAAYRAAFDGVGLDRAAQIAALHEAARAFALNIELSLEVGAVPRQG